MPIYLSIDKLLLKSQTNNILLEVILFDFIKMVIKHDKFQMNDMLLGRKANNSCSYTNENCLMYYIINFIFKDIRHIN